MLENFKTHEQMISIKRLDGITLEQMGRFTTSRRDRDVASSIIGGGGADIHIFRFCTINFNQLLLWFVNTNI